MSRCAKNPAMCLLASLVLLEVMCPQLSAGSPVQPTLVDRLEKFVRQEFLEDFQGKLSVEQMEEIMTKARPCLAEAVPQHNTAAIETLVNTMETFNEWSKVFKEGNFEDPATMDKLTQLSHKLDSFPDLTGAEKKELNDMISKCVDPDLSLEALKKSPDQSLLDRLEKGVREQFTQDFKDKLAKEDIENHLTQARPCLAAAIPTMDSATLTNLLTFMETFAEWRRLFDVDNLQKPEFVAVNEKLQSIPNIPDEDVKKISDIVEKCVYPKLKLDEALQETPKQPTTATA